MIHIIHNIVKNVQRKIPTQYFQIWGEEGPPHYVHSVAFAPRAQFRESALMDVGEVTGEAVVQGFQV